MPKPAMTAEELIALFAAKATAPPLESSQIEASQMQRIGRFVRMMEAREQYCRRGRATG